MKITKSLIQELSKEENITKALTYFTVRKDGDVKHVIQLGNKEVSVFFEIYEN